MNRLDTIISCAPQKIFIMIGTNDLTHGIDVDSIMINYEAIVTELHEALPDCLIFIESILPTKNAVKNKKILELNSRAEHFAEENFYVRYIDLYGSFTGSDGLIKSEYTIEGLHLTAAGYDLWKSLIEQFIY